MEGNYSCLKGCKETGFDIAAQLSKVRHGYRGEAQEIFFEIKSNFLCTKK